jgi:hypothetical protein
MQAASSPCRVTVVNETPWLVTALLPGQLRTQGTPLPPGATVQVRLPRRADPALIIAGEGRHRTYTLDLALLGYDTVHVHPEDLRVAG